jgi:hypothetical protein
MACLCSKIEKVFIFPRGMAARCCTGSGAQIGHNSGYINLGAPGMTENGRNWHHSDEAIAAGNVRTLG